MARHHRGTTPGINWFLEISSGAQPDDVVATFLGAGQHRDLDAGGQVKSALRLIIGPATAARFLTAIGEQGAGQAVASGGAAAGEGAGPAAEDVLCLLGVIEFAGAVAGPYVEHSRLLDELAFHVDRHVRLDRHR